MKRKVNTDREKPSSEEIRARKDFNSVLRQYQSSAATGKAGKPFFKSPGFLITAGMVVAAGASVLIYQVYSDQASSSINDRPVVQPASQTHTLRNEREMEETERKHVSPPLKNLQAPYQVIHIDAFKGGEFKSKDGSKITVPQNAFVDKSGKPLSGKVDLHFREFHDPLDFFLSGIPMNYDSTGNHRQFESAGMVEILGFQDGKPVFIVPGKKVDIQLVSKFPGSAYNVYAYDSLARNWIYLGKDHVVNLEKREKFNYSSSKIDAQAGKANGNAPSFESQPQVIALEEKMAGARKECTDKINALPPLSELPRKPVRAKNSRPRFHVDFKPEEFPEMNAYKDVVFEVGAENRDFSETEAYNTIWDDMRLLEGPRKGENYVLKLQKGVVYKQFIVYPVFEGKQFEEAMKNYNAAREEFDRNKEKHDSEEKVIRADYEKRLEGYVQSRMILRKDWDKQQVLKEQASAEKSGADFQNMSKEGKVLRCFSVSGFGIYNCGNPVNYPDGQLVDLKLTTSYGQPLSSGIYFADKNRNALFSIPKKDVYRLGFNPASDNMIWAVEGNSLFILKNEAFSGLRASGIYELKMDEVKQEFRNVEELKTFLGI